MLRVSRPKLLRDSQGKISLRFAGKLHNCASEEEARKLAEQVFQRRLTVALRLARLNAFQPRQH